MKSSDVSRRTALTTMAAGSGSLVLSASKAEGREKSMTRKGNINHSVCKWCYKDLTLEELCGHAVSMGITGIDLLSVADLPTIKPFGLTCPMVNGPGGIEHGWNEVALHDELVKKSEELLPQIAEAGMPNMIVFSGNRREMSDAEGIERCAKGLKRIMPLAESLGVNVVMELLNSKWNHKDYQCDKTPWGAALVDEVGSERFRLLYDIYHMQIMEGDVIQTIRDYSKYIAHYHTGGVPGRAEIDETQELNYPAICQAIVETGYTGFVAQEFIPKRDPVASLQQAIALCDV
jgi:hydroxypyruvate isomerase